MNNKELIELLKLERGVLLLDGKDLEELANMWVSSKDSFVDMVKAYFFYENDNIIKGNYKIESGKEYVKVEDNYTNMSVGSIKTAKEIYEEMKTIIFTLAYTYASNVADEHKMINYGKPTSTDYGLCVEFLPTSDFLENPENYIKENNNNYYSIRKTYMGWVTYKSESKVDMDDYHKRLEKIKK